MTLEADQIVDRRRLRRKVSFWRVAAFIFLAILIIGGIAWTAGRDLFPGLQEAQIARISVSGFISDDRQQQELIDKAGDSPAVKAVIVSIDSTGGATAGGEALYEALRKLALKKPTVASIGTVGASAAYMAAVATDHVVARRTSITGSIGVLFQYPEISKLLDNLGVKIEEVKSAPLKAEPSPFKPASDESKAVIAGMIKDTYDWFVDIVAERRSLTRTDALALADGRVYTGRQALALKLIDEIGGEETAIAWLATKGIDSKLPVRDWQPKRSGFGLFSADAVFMWFAKQIGLAPEFGRGVIERILPDRLKLDGMVSVWQASGDNDAGSGPGGG